VLLTHTQTIDDFRYADDGILVTSFEPGMLDRYGTEPDRFVEQMRQVGLPATISDDRAVDPMIALLQMLTVALGIWVPRDRALGPLLTVQRETALPRPQPQPRPQFTTEPLTQAWQLRSHLQRLIDGGVTHDAIYAQSGYRLSKHSIDAIPPGCRHLQHPRRNRRAGSRHRGATQRVTLLAY
jgi:hypothetical protein